jgi:hypothetical protein
LRDKDLGDLCRLFQVREITPTSRGSQRGDGFYENLNRLGYLSIFSRHILKGENIWNTGTIGRPALACPCQPSRTLVDRVSGLCVVIHCITLLRRRLRAMRALRVRARVQAWGLGLACRRAARVLLTSGPCGHKKTPQRGAAGSASLGQVTYASCESGQSFQALHSGTGQHRQHRPSLWPD